MAEEPKKEDAEGGEVAEGGKSKKKLIIIIAGAAVLLIGIGAGAFFFLKGSHPSGDAAAGEHSEATDEVGGEEGAAKGKAEGTEHGEKAKEKGHGEKAKDGEKKEGHGEKAKDGEKAKEKGHGEKDSKEEEGAAGDENPNFDFGATYNFRPFHLNLGNPLENRYIRLEMSVEYKNGQEQLKEIEARLPQLRDAILSVASRKTKEFLLGPDGKDQLRLEVLNKLNQYMDRKIEAVYITDMIIE